MTFPNFFKDVSPERIEELYQKTQAKPKLREKPIRLTQFQAADSIGALRYLLAGSLS